MSNHRKIPAEDCPCREGMFPGGKVSRRGLLFAAGSTAGLAAASLARPALAAAQSAPPGAIHYGVAADPTKEQGRPTFEDGGYGSRSQFETAVRLLAPNPNTTFTPLADLLGNITPSGLHYERHHAGIPMIDPAKHSLVIHGLVGTPKRFTMTDIRRMPSVTRRYFIECSGNTQREAEQCSQRCVRMDGTVGYACCSRGCTQHSRRMNISCNWKRGRSSLNKLAHGCTPQCSLMSPATNRFSRGRIEPSIASTLLYRFAAVLFFDQPSQAHYPAEQDRNGDVEVLPDEDRTGRPVLYSWR